MPSKHADKVVDSWDKEWEREIEDAGGVSPSSSGLKSRIKAMLGGSALTRYCVRYLYQEAGGSVGGMKFMEAGCGTSNIALVLAKDGAKCFQLDLSSNAMTISKEVFAKGGEKGFLIQGDLFHLPFEDDSLDLVWNVGVLEHFTEDLQDDILKEMIRVTSPTGKVVTFNPYAKGYIYRFGKWFSEKVGKWPIGYEVPILTLRPNLKRIDSTLKVREYSFGFLLQFLVYKHLFKKKKKILSLYSVAYELINFILSPLNRLPGFLLVTVIEKTRE